MLKFLLITGLLTNMAFAQESFITKSSRELKFKEINGKLWCSNGAVSFRYLIKDTDLSESHPRVEIKSLLIMNNSTGEYKTYLPLPYKTASTLLADKAFMIEGGEPEGQFPAVYMESYPHYQPTEISILHSLEPGNMIAKKVYLNYSSTDYSVHDSQSYFQNQRGSRLMVVCGGWDFEKNYAFDPNPFN